MAGSTSVLLDPPFSHTNRRANRAASGIISKLGPVLQQPSATPLKKVSRPRLNGDTRKSEPIIPSKTSLRTSLWEVSQVLEASNSPLLSSL